MYIKEGKGKLALFYTASNVLLTPLLFIFCFPSSSSSSFLLFSLLLLLLLHLLISIVFPRKCQKASRGTGRVNGGTGDSCSKKRPKTSLLYYSHSLSIKKCFKEIWSTLMHTSFFATCSWPLKTISRPLGARFSKVQWTLRTRSQNRNLKNCGVDSVPLFCKLGFLLSCCNL